jgi:hypothetical protein
MPSKSPSAKTPLSDSCVENNSWAAVPVPPSPPSPQAPLVLALETIDLAAAAQIAKTQQMKFHTLGCSGDPDTPAPGQAVAAAMASQAAGASFLYHLGDVIYRPDKSAAPDNKKQKKGAPKPPKPDSGPLFNQQFFQQYAKYPKSIFALAGNHDGKGLGGNDLPGSSPMEHFLQNFCAATRAASLDDSGKTGRLTMTQPYPYWCLDTPVASFIGLYTNIINGGQLDDPNGNSTPQETWFRGALTAAGKTGKTIILALHYPPYSGAVNFMQRGDPNKGGVSSSGQLRPIGQILQDAFQATQVFPDVILSAHAHHYQRLTYNCADGRQIPCLIAGSGGHSPTEPLFQDCSGTLQPEQKPPFPAQIPPVLTLPKGDSVQVEAYNDQAFGFLTLTVDAAKGKLTGEFSKLHKKTLNLHKTLADSFTLDLRAHKLVKT